MLPVPPVQQPGRNFNEEFCLLFVSTDVLPSVFFHYYYSSVWIGKGEGASVGLESLELA